MKRQLTKHSGRPANRSRPAVLAGVLLLALLTACEASPDGERADRRPPLARFEIADPTVAAYALDSFLNPPLVAPPEARCGGLFVVDEIGADAITLRPSDMFDDDEDSSRSATAVAEHLFELLDPRDPHPEAFRLYFIEGAADYARGHAPAHRVGIRAEDERVVLRRVDGRDVTLTARSGEIVTRLTHPAFSPPREATVNRRLRAQLRESGTAVVSIECEGELTVEIVVRGDGTDAEATGAGSAGPEAGEAHTPPESFVDFARGDRAVDATLTTPGLAYDLLIANTSGSAEGTPADSGYAGERYGESAAPAYTGGEAARAPAGISRQLGPLVDIEFRREVMRIARAALDRPAAAGGFRPAPAGGSSPAPTGGFERVSGLGNTSSARGLSPRVADTEMLSPRVGLLEMQMEIEAAPADPTADPSPTDGSRSVPTRSVAPPAGAASRARPLRLIAAPELVPALESVAGALTARGVEVSRDADGDPRAYIEALFTGDFDLALVRWESESGAPGEILRLFRSYDPRNYTGSGAPESFEVFARERHEIGFALYSDDGDDGGGRDELDDDGDDRDGREEVIERFGSPRVTPYGVPYF